MNFALISYDISDDQMRTQVSKYLKNHGYRVQKSVFECRLPEKKLQEIHNRLSQMIDPTTDSVRLYRLCKRCLWSVETLGRGSPPDEGDELPVII